MNSLKTLINEAVGAASMCWENVDKAGVFQTTQAAAIAEELYQRIVTQYRRPMRMTREEVYKLIDGERAYQDSLWNPETTPSGGRHSPAEWLVHIQDYAQEAMHIGTRESDETAYDKQLAIIRKIAGMAVACMEDHGAPVRLPRKGV
jgi:hypothetical protein